MRPGRRTAVAVIVIILAGVWGNASAAILTFEQTQLLNFDFSAFSFSPPFTGAIGVNIGTNFLPGEPVYGALPSSARGVYFEGFGHDFTVGGTAADLGITGGSGFTGYGLHVANWDNQPWEFSIFANLATGSYESSFLSLAGQDDSALKPGGSTDLFLAFD
ncbi:MAG: hypothetical protein HZA60_05510, partial [Deltaproteobacteria bacterium]|nr:hypothetical protein [Deltaproteobacteria bacterium]